MPVVETVAIRDGGERELLERLEAAAPPAGPRRSSEWHTPTFEQIQATQREVRRILHAAGYDGTGAPPRAAARSTRW